MNLRDLGALNWWPMLNNTWKAKVRPVEAGCRGFVGMSTTRLRGDMEIRGQAQSQAIKALSNATEKASQ